MLAPWLPWPPFDGGRIRMLETLRFLSKRHEVTLLAHIHSEDERRHVDALRQYCKRVEVYAAPDSPAHRIGTILLGLFRWRAAIQSVHFSSRLARRIAELTATEDFDIVHMEFSFFAHYVAAISPTSRAKLILSTHNIESERLKRESRISPFGFRRLAVAVDGAFFPDWEERAVQLFDGVAAVSESDRAWIADRTHDVEVALAPNGVDTLGFASRDERSASTTNIVFTGVMDYPPNVDAVAWFAREIWPLLRKRKPDAQLLIVGARPTPAVAALGQHEGITVTGAVEDIRPYVAGALTFVVPLRSGGGTRLKILQAMAIGCPVISTAIGAEGLAVTDGEDILLAETPEDFVTQVLALERSPQLARRIGAAGRALVAKQYDWSACLAGIQSLYDRVLRTSTP
ncbi:MAG: glycosyltransferase [Gammaproteobacteria bacterium]